MKSPAFVLGNGTSRKTINLNDLKHKGIIFGCNALYRDFSPHYLVAVDTKMILEINQAGYQHQHQVWTNRNKNFKKIKGLNFFQSDKGWSSGPTALHFASTTDVEDIYILGFDFRGLPSGNGQYNKVNNLFSDTQNYKRSVDPATYFGNWERQTLTTIKNNPNTRYIRVIKDGDDFIPKQLRDLSNLEQIFVSDFKNQWHC